MGLGLQSTVLHLMAAHGEIEPFDYVICSDTHRETRAVYEHLRWLQSPNMGLPPITMVTAGDLGADTLASAGTWSGLGGAAADRSTWLQASRVANPPFFTRGPRTVKKSVLVEAMPLLGLPGQTVELIVERHTDRETFGILRRKCTKEYKIEPVTAEIRRILGLAPGERGPSVPIVEHSMGLTTDELERLPSSSASPPFIYLRNPLIEKRMSRGDCDQWRRRRGYPPFPKSRCYFCPFQDDSLWREMKDESPDEFEEACRFDEAIRNGIRGTTTQLFLHSLRIPLREVDFTRPNGLWSVEGLRNECEGVCGI